MIGFRFAGSKRRPDMAVIYVKTREGKRAYYSGREIPHDHFVPVPDVPFIRRLIDHHHDVEVKDQAAYDRLKNPTAKEH
jgi:hypothetical protein